jgi:hypothetical protein
MAEHKWQAKNKGEEKAIAEHIALQKAKDAKDAKDAKARGLTLLGRSWVAKRRGKTLAA